MKNFPHQFNDLSKLTQALVVIDNLNALGLNVSDDGVLGSELAIAEVYSFRKLTTTVSDRLNNERLKPRSNQGFRTAARDIRRFFHISDLIGSDNQLSQAGKELIVTKARTPLNLALWRDAMLRTKLTSDSGEVSHPYRILLRLVDEFPGVETGKLLLALEARNDSESEFDRLKSLAILPQLEIEEQIGVTRANAKNAVKILPAIAEQVGDIKRQNKQAFPHSPYSANEDEFYTKRDYPIKLSNKPKPIKPAEIAKAPVFLELEKTAFDLSAGIAIRQKRTIRHQETVISFAELLSKNHYDIYEHPYDCLAHKNGKGTILAEIKTLDGSPSDERKQSINALGQLRAYRFFNVGAEIKTPKLREVMVFDKIPSPETVNFAHHNNISVAWFHNGWVTISSSGETVNFEPDTLLS